MDVSTIIPDDADTMEMQKRVVEYLECHALMERHDLNAMRKGAADKARIAAQQTRADIAALNYARANRVYNEMEVGRCDLCQSEDKAPFVAVPVEEES